MDAQIEGLIELFLTRGGQVFVSPQYGIPYDEEKDGDSACPDFVALDFLEKEVIIVEVSGAYKITSLLSKIEDRQARWFDPIMGRLRRDEVIRKDWTKPPRVIGFIRRDRMKAAHEKFKDQNDVCFFAIEDAAFSFAYWTERKKGLPRDTRLPEKTKVPN